MVVEDEVEAVYKASNANRGRTQVEDHQWNQCELSLHYHDAPEVEQDESKYEYIKNHFDGENARDDIDLSLAQFVTSLIIAHYQLV